MPRHVVSLLVVLLLSVPVSALAQTVYLVRHAEKQPQGQDLGLTTPVKRHCHGSADRARL